ncbi:hypothetical protein [Actinokineospora iranica]|uniref:hypothetical protein n=1 Tax=Actinokineospora iranica TaxID=1271860 RepID=UPI0011137E26|nr:hypothetical protein [Actinokineospora iranica]
MGDATTCLAEFPSCPECGEPLTLHGDTKYVHCRNEDCSCDAIPAGDVVLECGQSGRGLPRPVLDGRPVPWLAPIIGDQVAWAAFNAARHREAQQSWLCQICGESLATASTAWLAVSAGEVAAGGGMHRECMALARRECPVLREDHSFVFMEIRCEDLADKDWSAVIERLVMYEEQHGRLPALVPLEQDS